MAYDIMHMHVLNSPCLLGACVYAVCFFLPRLTSSCRFPFDVIATSLSESTEDGPIMIMTTQQQKTRRAAYTRRVRFLQLVLLCHTSATVDARPNSCTAAL
jgi:hypothetical protein